MRDTVRNKLKRTPLLAAGLFVLALGVALSTKSGLGVSPSSSVAYLLSEIFPLSMGTFTTPKPMTAQDATHSSSRRG